MIGQRTSVGLGSHARAVVACGLDGQTASDARIELVGWRAPLPLQRVEQLRHTEAPTRHTSSAGTVAEDLVARYASRWVIEQAFADARQIIGVGEARNRTRRAVEQTLPFGLICFSVVTVWYALHGHTPDDVTGHRARARWYTTKTEPSYDDMTSAAMVVIGVVLLAEPLVG